MVARGIGLFLACGLCACSEAVPTHGGGEVWGTGRASLLVDDRSMEIVSEIAAAVPAASADCTTQVRWAFAALYTNVNVATANARLTALDTSANVPDSTEIEAIPCYWAMSLLVRTYLHSVTEPRLSAATKQALRQMMWRYVNQRSLYSDATWPNTWHIHMSENHDAMQKSVYLLATNALRANMSEGTLLADGRTLLEHQNAWRGFWKLYFQERAREGIGLEIASPAYSKHVLQTYYNVRDFGGSSILRDQAEKFLTLYWADVAQDFQPTTGVRGGAASRAYRDKYSQTGAGQIGLRPWTYLYGWHDAHDWTDPTYITTLFPATSSYRIPDIVTDMAVSRTKSAFVYASRRPGLQESNPQGSGDTLRYQIGFDPHGNSNLRRYTFNTQDYVMGTLKVEPAPLYAGVSRYSNLNRQNRWMGVVFANGPDARIAVMGRGTGGSNPDLENRNGYSEILGDAGRNVMLIARDPSVQASDATRIFISSSVWGSGPISQGGWLFFQSGGAYAGVRIATGGYSLLSPDTAYGKRLELGDMWSPIVIQLGQASQYSSFSAFRSAVTAAPFNYSAAGEVTYTSPDFGDVYRIRRNSYVLPSVNGGGSLDPAKTYSSPYILGYHGENTVTLTYDSRPPLVLDFTF